MSDKEVIMELIRRMPDNATVGEIIAALTTQRAAERPAAEPEYTDEELTEDEWRQLVAYSLRDELADPREDIYTEEDGEPSHGPR